MHQIHGSLLCDDTRVLDSNGLFGDGSFHFGTHGNGSGKAADTGRSGDLVACGHRALSHRSPYARRRQFLDANRLNPCSHIHPLLVPYSCTATKHTDLTVQSVSDRDSDICVSSAAKVRGVRSSE